MANIPAFLYDVHNFLFWYRCLVPGTCSTGTLCTLHLYIHWYRAVHCQVNLLYAQFGGCMNEAQFASKTDLDLDGFPVRLVGWGPWLILIQLESSTAWISPSHSSLSKNAQFPLRPRKQQVSHQIISDVLSTCLLPPSCIAAVDDVQQYFE